MLTRLTARTHVALLAAGDRLTRLGRDERGQGTVEYVALIVLVGVVLASVVAVTRGKHFGDEGIATTIIRKIKAAMGAVK